MSKDEFTIRPPRAEDGKNIVPLWRIIAATHYDYDPEFWKWSPDAEQHWEKDFHRLLHRDNMVMFVAEAPDGELVGFIVSEVISPQEIFFAPKRGHIWDLAICPDYRRRGLARRLIENTMEKMKQMGTHDVILHVAIENTAAIALYEKLGMRRIMYRMYKKL